MPRGRAQGRGRGRRRGRSSDRRQCGVRRLPGKAWTDSDDSLVPPANQKLPAVALPPSTSVAQSHSDQPHCAEECSQDSTVLTALLSAVVHCHLKGDVGQVLQNEGICRHSAVDSEGAKLHFSLDTNVLTANICRSSTAGECNVYRSVPPSPQSLCDTTSQDVENFQFHSLRRLASRSPGSNHDRNLHGQTVSESRAQSAGPHNTVTDSQILDTDFVSRSKYISSTKQDKSLFADHNHNFLSSFTSGSSGEVFQSDSENSLGTSSPAIKQQCFHSTFPSTLCNDTAANRKSVSVWDFAPPLEVPQMWPVPFDRPTKQNVEFSFETERDSVLPNAKISCQSEFILPSRNTSTLFSHYNVPKWKHKPLPKRHLSKLRSVKSANAALKRIQKDKFSLIFIALEQGFFIFCSRCYRPGRMHPRNKNKIIKKRFHRKYWNNLHISKNEELSKISDKNGEIKCCSCHRPLWKCHRNNKMFRITEMTPNSHPDLASKHVMNEMKEITRKGVSGTGDSTLRTTNRLQNHLSNFSDKQITKTAAEDNDSKVCTNLQHVNQNLDATSKFEFPNGTFVVQVPCQTGQEFMEMSNKFNPYPYKISGIFGSENGISACLEDQGDLSNEFDFDINNSGELTLPSYEPQLVVSKDKAENWNFGKNNVFITVMRKPNSSAEGISHFAETADKTARSSETADPPTGTAQPPPDDAEQINSFENTRQESNEAVSKVISSNREETIGHKNSYVQTTGMDFLHGVTYHRDAVLQTDDTTRGQLTSIESMHSGNNKALSEEISSDINKTVFHKKNYIENLRITAHNNNPRTDDNTREHLNPTEKTNREGTDAQLGEISPVMIEKLGHNKGSATGGSCNEESAGQTMTGEAECSICIKEEEGEYRKETLEMVNANLLQKTDLCSNHSTCREKINTCENTAVRFSGSVTVKEETVKDEEDELGPDGSCDSLNCYMCDEERKLMLRLSATARSEPVDAASSSVLASKDKLLTQSWQNNVSSVGCSSDKNSSINNSSGEVKSLHVQSSDSITNSADLTRSDKEELYRQPAPSRSPRKTVEEVPERNGATLELQEPINPTEFFCSDNNNCLEEQIAEQLNSLSSNSIDTFDYVVSEQEADEIDEIENQLHNLFSENSEDSFTSEIQVNDTVGSVKFMERDTEYRLCSIQEELSNQNVPYGIANEDRLHLTCDSSSTKESQNCVTDVENKCKERTEDNHNAENEINGDMSAVIPWKETTEYKLYNFEEELGSITQPIIEHEVDYQQSSDVSSTNVCHDNLIMKHESSSDQERGSCNSYSETDSDSFESVQIRTEIRHSESTLNNQLDNKPLCAYPLSSISSEDMSKSLGSGCSHISSTTEMMSSENFLTNQADGRVVSQYPLSSFKTKETCKSLDSDCTSTLDRATIDHSEGTSNNQPAESQVSKSPQNNVDSQDASTLAKTLKNTIDFDGTSAAETMHCLKNTTDFPEMELKDVPVIRVSIPLSSITDPGLLKRLMSEKKRRKAGHTGPPLAKTAERRKLTKLSDVQYSPTSSSKRKAFNKDERRRMNGKGKRTFEKVSQVNEIGDQPPVPDLPSLKVSEKNNENDDARARDATTKYRAVPDNNEKTNSKATCKEKNAHQSAVVTQCEDGSEEEGELQICEEALEEGEEGVAQDDNSEENVAVLSHDNTVEEKQSTSGHTYKSGTLIKAQYIEGSNVTAHKRDDVLESSHYSSGNQIAQQQCEDLSSVPDKHESLCKIKLSTSNQDGSQMTVFSNTTQKEPLSPPQKLPEIKHPCSPLQQMKHQFSRTNLSDETSGPTASGDSNLTDVKPKEAMELRLLDALDVQVALQSEKGTLGFDEGSNKLSSDHRMGFDDTSTPLRKISRKNINERDVHVKSSEQQETGDSHSSLYMNKVLMCSSSKSSARRISSKGRMKYADLESLPPSYHILRRDLNEVLEQEKLCQTLYSLPRKVPKKLSIARLVGYRRLRECRKIQMINDAGESTSKKIRRDESEYADSEVTAEAQGKECIQKEMECMPDHYTHTTKGKCELDTNLTGPGNPDVHQHQKEEKPAVVQPEEMEICHDKPALAEKESAVHQVSVPTVILKRCDGSSWRQCAKQSTVVETGDSNEKTPVPDKCGKTDRVPEKNEAAEHKPSHEREDRDDTASVSSRCNETEMVNKTSITKEQLNDQPKQKRNTSQKIQEYDHKSLVCTERKDDKKVCVEEKGHPNLPSKSVEVTDEAVCFHGDKSDIEASHSQANKLPSLVENKKSNVCTEAEQFRQCLSLSPDDNTALENNVNNPHRATTCNSPVHLQSRQEDFSEEDSGNKQHDQSVNCGIVEEVDETNRSSSRVAASLSEDEVSQNCVERRTESPHFKNIDQQTQETTIVCWQQKLQETMADLFSLMKKGEPFKNAAVAMMTQALEQMQESQKKTQQSLQHRIQTEVHTSVSDALIDNTKEQSAPKQLNQEPKVEFQNPVSECEEINEQQVTQMPLQKSATDFQDPVEEPPLKHPVSECSEANEQHITQKPLQKSATNFQDPIEELPCKHPVSECDATNEQHITQKPLQKSATDCEDSVEELPLSQPVSECDATNEQLITQKPLQNSATDFQTPVEQLPLKHPVSECDETNKQHITQNSLEKSASDCQDPLEKVPLKHPVSECDETSEGHITQKSASDFQDPEKKLPTSTNYEAVSQDVALIQRVPSTQEVGRSQTRTENDTAQHTGCGSQIHNTGPRSHTPQSQQAMTSRQFHPQESLSCSEHLKQYSKQTPAAHEETIGQQKADEQCAKERQPLQRKDTEPHNPQVQMFTQQQVQDQHRIMLNTIKQQKQQFSSTQQIAQEKDVKCDKEIQQSSLQPSVIQSRAAVQQWHHTQQRPAQHHQIQCTSMEKLVPQQQSVYSGSTEAEKAASVVQNPMGCHQALLRQQQQMQHLASLEQQAVRQLSTVPNPMGPPQQSVQQHMEWQQQRAAHLVPKQYPTVEHQTVPQNQQQAHPYHRYYYPQIQQPYQLPHPTEVQLRPSYPHQYHSRFSSPQTLNSNSHLLRQMPCCPLEGQQMQPQQQQYPQFHHQQQLEKWHPPRRPGTDEAATVPAILASPSIATSPPTMSSAAEDETLGECFTCRPWAIRRKSLSEVNVGRETLHLSGGTVVESEHDRRRILSREAINSFDAGHRIGAVVPSSSCPVTPTNAENIHTPQPHPSQAYMRTGPHPQPHNSTALVQAPMNTGSIQQRAMKVVPTSTVDEDQQGEEGRFKIPEPPRVSAFVERVMKHYQPDILDTEDIFRHQYKLPERELAAQFAFPQESVYTRHGTTSIQQLPCSQPVMMFSEHTRFPASLTQQMLNKTVHSLGQSLHRVFVPPPASSFDESVNNSPVNVPVNRVQPSPISKTVNVHDLHTDLNASSSRRISQEASLSSVSENLNCDCNVIDLSQDKNTSEDNSRCCTAKWSDRSPRGTELDCPVMEKTDSTSSSKAVDEVPQSSDCIQDNVPDNTQLKSSTTKTVYHSVLLGKKRKSETLCGTPEKRLCQDTDSDASALPSTGTHQVTAMDLSPSTVVECTAESIPSQSSPHVLGASYPQLCATNRPALDSKQPAMNGKSAISVNCGQQNQGLCTAGCCERSACATHTTRLAAAGSTCCGTTQQSQHSPNDER